ncbi:MAG: hypothetical protein ACJAWV_001364 [Flammeovirgaceae bacterium]|jgi:hypothetical protein
MEKTKSKNLIVKAVFQLLKLVVLIALPFIVLVRASVFFHANYWFYPYFSLSLAFFLTLLVLLIYFLWIYASVFGRKSINKRSLKIKGWIATILLLSYCTYTLFFLSKSNAKTEVVKSEFVSLHPILRVSVGTIVLADQSMLITDMSRTTEDYKSMGLKTLKNSLHYPQKDGYVHAIDLRTNNRSEFRNRLLKYYFRLMGFHTLRHMGTADHLHISLPIEQNPNAI